MRIAVDAMGGDNAPQAIVEGALDAVEEYGVEITLVGPQSIAAQELAKRGRRARAGKIDIVDAPETIRFDEPPALAVKTRKGLSMRVMCDLVLQGRADACLTMGHTGAALVAGLLAFGRIEGIARPAVGVLLLGLQPNTFVIDVGANVDCKPEYLLHFALMGSVYMERVRGIENPRVALLANGAEDNKGNALVQATFPLLKSSSLNFVGNIEALDLFSGRTNVVVADGMAGNVVLKLTEGLAEHMVRLVEQGMTAQLTGESLARAQSVIAELRQKSDYAETGAMPLLGVNHLILIGHGRANARATKNGIRETMRAVEGNLVQAIREGLARLDQKQE